MRSRLALSVLLAVTLVVLSASAMSLTVPADSWPAHISRLMRATRASASATIASSSAYAALMSKPLLAVLALWGSSGAFT